MPPHLQQPSTTPPLSFLVPLLALILSADPIALPRTLLAQSAQQAVHYLGLTPEDEEYWTLGRKDEEVSRLRRELVEAGSVDDLTPSAPLFSHDLEELRCLIPLSLPPSRSSSSDTLGVVLVWEDSVSPLSAAQGGHVPMNQEAEEEDDVRPGWTFLELQAVPSPTTLTTKNRQSWYSTLDEAVEASTAGLVQALAGAGGGGGGGGKGMKQSARSDEREKLMEAMAGFEADGASLRSGVGKGEHSEEEGDERNGGAMASAEDFWAGWDDVDRDGNDGARTPNGRQETGGASEENEDRGYWDSYSGVGSQVGEGAEESLLERIPSEASTSPTPLAPHNPQPPFRLTRESASVLASPSLSDADRDARPLYFSSTLPPLPDSHFGISPTQPNPEISRFSTTDTAASIRSGASHYDFLIEPSEDEEDGDEWDDLPTKLDVGPARSASLAQAVPPSHLTTNQTQTRSSPAAPTRPTGHARTASDILKALPSVPAFPTVSRPRNASNGLNGSTKQVLEGSVYVNAPGGGGPTNQRSPTSPSRTPTVASDLSRSPSSSARRSPIKALPPAPTPRTPNRTVSHPYASPSPSRGPQTQRSPSSSGVPRTPRAGTASSAAGGEGGGDGVRSPVRNGGFWAPTSAAASRSGSSEGSARTINIPAPTLAVKRQGSQTTPLPSLAVFPSSSLTSAPPFALPPPPVIGRRSVDSTATGLTGMLEELVRGTMAGQDEELEELGLKEGEGGRWVEEAVRREEEKKEEEEDGEEEEADEALKVTLGGLWRMYARVGRRDGASGVGERRRRFEAVVREVVGE